MSKDEYLKMLYVSAEGLCLCVLGKNHHCGHLKNMDTKLWALKFKYNKMWALKYINT